MPLSTIQLGAVAYPYAPVRSTNPQVRALASAATFGGTVYSDWGYADSDRTITHEWDWVEGAFFAQLDALQAPGTLPLSDEWGQAWTVYVRSLTYDRFTPQAELYQNVRLALAVVRKGP